MCVGGGGIPEWAGVALAVSNGKRARDVQAVPDTTPFLDCLAPQGHTTTASFLLWLIPAAGTTLWQVHLEEGGQLVPVTVTGLSQHGYLEASDGRGERYELHPDGNRSAGRVWQGVWQGRACASVAGWAAAASSRMGGWGWAGLTRCLVPLLLGAALTSLRGWCARRSAEKVSWWAQPLPSPHCSDWSVLAAPQLIREAHVKRATLAYNKGPASSFLEAGRRPCEDARGRAQHTACTLLQEGTSRSQPATPLVY